MTKFILPIKNAKVSQLFGANPYIYEKWLGLEGHNGVDLATFWGDKVIAPYDALVVAVRNRPTGFGKHIWLCNGEYLTVYGHLSEIYVKAGEKVTQGTLIGREGNTGAVLKDGVPTTVTEDGFHYGTHLHWGVYKVTQPMPHTYQMGFSQTGKNYTIINYNNGYHGAIDPMTLINMGITKEKLYQIFHEILLREPTLAEKKTFLNQAEDYIRETIGKSPQRKKIIKWVNILRKAGIL